jgi:low affinity Fe/Cu permease
MPMRVRKADMPSSETPSLSWFDRFATTASRVVSKAWFFSICVLLVVVWLPTVAIIPSVDTWQLVINTVTTVITFLLVALLQNSQSRAEAAVQKKLNAIAEALSEIMDKHDADLTRAITELRDAVGLEHRESS